MKRTLLTAIVALSMCGLVSNASAGQKHRKRDENNNSNQSDGSNNSNNENSGNSRKFELNQDSNSPAKRTKKFNPLQAEQSSNIRPSWKAKKESSSAFESYNMVKKQGQKHQQQLQLDPGRPDGRVQVADVPTPVTSSSFAKNARPGFIYVNGHWERAKPGGYTIQTPANTEVRDHRGPVEATGQTIYGEGPGLHSLWDLVTTDIPSLRLQTEDHRDNKTPYTTSKLPPPPSVRPPRK